MYSRGIQNKTILAKMHSAITVLAQIIGDSDEAIDSHKREASPMEYSDGFEYTAPAYLSYYSSTGTGVSWQDALIERLEKAQAGYWADEHPDRPDLFDEARADESSLQAEAQEWLDAALEGECIYLQLEIQKNESDITIRAEFSDEINRPYTSHVVTIPIDEFMAMDDEALEKLLDGITAKVYEKTE